MAHAPELPSTRASWPGIAPARYRNRVISGLLHAFRNPQRIVLEVLKRHLLPRKIQAHDHGLILHPQARVKAQPIETAKETGDLFGQTC
jgi:hypothetical protein